MTVTVHPATIDRFDDVAAVLGPKRQDAPACWCLSYRITSQEYNALRGADRPERLKSFCSEDRGPGVVAYVDGVPAGWCSIAPRSSMERLVRSRTVPKIDDAPVWSVVCFIVRPEYRRQGLSRDLLSGAVEYASSCGAEIVEAYPIETGGARVGTAFAFVGTTDLFEAAGFDRVVQTDAKSGGRARWLMRRRVP